MRWRVAGASWVVLVALLAACTPERGAPAARVAALNAHVVGPEIWLLPLGPPTRRTVLESVVLTDEGLVFGGGGFASDLRWSPPFSWWLETDAFLESLGPLRAGRSSSPVRLAQWGPSESLEITRGGPPAYGWIARRFDERGEVAEELPLDAEYAVLGFGPAGWVAVWAPWGDGPRYLSIAPIELSPLRLGTPWVTDVPYTRPPISTAGTETHHLVQTPTDDGWSLSWLDASLTRVGSVAVSSPPLACGRHHCLTGSGDGFAVWTSPGVSVVLEDPSEGVPMDRDPVFAPFGDSFVQAWTSFGTSLVGNSLHFATLSVEGVSAVTSVPTEMAGDPVAVGREDRAVALTVHGGWDVGPLRRGAVVRFDGRGPELLEWTLPAFPEIQLPDDGATARGVVGFVVARDAVTFTAHLLPNAEDLLPSVLLGDRPAGRYAQGPARLDPDGEGFVAQWGWWRSYLPPGRAARRVGPTGALGHVSAEDSVLRAIDYMEGARSRVFATNEWAPDYGTWGVAIDAGGNDVGEPYLIWTTPPCRTQTRQLRHDLWVAWCAPSAGVPATARLVHLPADDTPQVLDLGETHDFAFHAAIPDRALVATWGGRCMVVSNDAVLASSQLVAADEMLSDVGHDGRAWVLATFAADGTLVVRWLDDGLVELDRVAFDDLSTSAGAARIAGLGGTTVVAYARQDLDTVGVRAAVRTIVRVGEVGVVCSADVACASGHCVDGVCCESACGGCGSCSGVLGPIGRCSPMPAHTVCRAPASACDEPAVCDGTVLECPDRSEPMDCPDVGATDASSSDAGVATDAAAADALDVGRGDAGSEDAAAIDSARLDAGAATRDAGRRREPTGGGDCRCAMGRTHQGWPWAWFALVMVVVGRRLPRPRTPLRAQATRRAAG